MKLAKKIGITCALVLGGISISIPLATSMVSCSSNNNSAESNQNVNEISLTSEEAKEFLDSYNNTVYEKIKQAGENVALYEFETISKSENDLFNFILEIHFDKVDVGSKVIAWTDVPKYLSKCFQITNFSPTDTTLTFRISFKQDSNIYAEWTYLKPTK